jgi:copper(I)-binding protein
VNAIISARRHSDAAIVHRTGEQAMSASYSTLRNLREAVMSSARCAHRRFTRRILATAVRVLLLGGFGITHVFAQQAMSIVNLPWAVPSTDGRSALVYMDLTSSDDAALVAVHSDAATSTRLLAPQRTPVPSDRLWLRANATVKLAPDGYRVALDGLRHAIKLGDHVAFTLTIEHADGSRQDIPTTAEVRMHSPLDDERRAHHDHH